MRNIIIKNDQGKTLAVHVYGEGQLRKYEDDLAFFKSTLPDFLKIETIKEDDHGYQSDWLAEEDHYVEEKFINNPSFEPKTLYAFRKRHNPNTKAYKNMLKSVYDHIKHGYVVKLWNGVNYVDKADFINHTRSVYLYEEERTIVMEVF